MLWLEHEAYSPWRKDLGRRVNNWSMLDIRALAIQNAGLGVNSTEAFAQGFNSREIKLFTMYSMCFHFLYQLYAASGESDYLNNRWMDGFVLS